MNKFGGAINKINGILSGMGRHTLSAAGGMESALHARDLMRQSASSLEKASNPVYKRFAGKALNTMSTLSTAQIGMIDAASIVGMGYGAVQGYREHPDNRAGGALMGGIEEKFVGAGLGVGGVTAMGVFRKFRK